ncbi:hypothetical protein ABI_32960 [Asticcacaulis biprosthecium C19]|uniref:Tat twin-arginine translocation pathway signal sequence domain protein n=1 Tax=Asticcacaulis biprosthecium C19 TaxID=715226 RepID=F4QPZ3_9CAUL|nr:hypothetical protein [Asticcacaulis biprosthecium]EGF90280.1 hypothetical protein ABI_32960 [Asticcacaulis biprosthecium C19]
MLNRRSCLAGLTGASMAVLGFAARAADPLLVYADGLQSGWWIGGWAKNTPQFPLEDQKPVQVNMEAWNVLTFQTGTPVDTTAYQTLTIVVHGGDEGKQEFQLSAKLGEKVVSQELTIKCQKGQWGRVDVPLRRMKIKGPIDTLFLQNKSADKMAPFYVNYVLFQ